MEPSEGSPARGFSRTALSTAYLRAAHMLLDSPPHILEDPLALRLLGPEAEQRIRKQEGDLQTPSRRGLRAHVVLRSRYAEDRLQAAVARGVRQFVLLGAGLETFAFRQPEWARGLGIFEVDSPATQGLKRRLLQAAELVPPSNVHLCPVDFEKEPLGGALGRCGISSDLPTFFSWLGVSMYLSEAAVEAVLRCAAGFPENSELVLTFARPRGEEASPIERRAAEVGEPWQSCFEPEQLEAALRAAGFTRVEFLSVDQARARYFDRRPQDLDAPRRVSIASAVR